MYVKFPSLAHSAEHGYAFESRPEWSSNVQVDRRFRMFQTYGDGMIQHSPDWAITREHMLDYLASLSRAMLNSSELTEELRSDFTQRVPLDRLNFAASVKYKTGDEDWTKRRYVSIGEQAIVGRKKGEYDKRYEEIQTWMNGSAESMYRLLIANHTQFPKAMDCYFVAVSIYDWYSADSRNRVWSPRPADLLEWCKDGKSEALAWENAWESCEHIAQAHNSAKRAEIAFRNYMRGLEQRTPAPATVEAPASESAA